MGSCRALRLLDGLWPHDDAASTRKPAAGSPGRAASWTRSDVWTAQSRGLILIPLALQQFEEGEVPAAFATFTEIGVYWQAMG